MSLVELNIMQERELNRLIDYERANCSVGGNLVYRCAFPYRPDDNLQAELIACGVLMAKADEKRGQVVTITSDGYSYFPAKRRAETERERAKRRETRLIGTSALFALLCVVVGFVMGRLIP